MAKTININPAVLDGGSNVSVTVDVTESGHTVSTVYSFNANDFDCSYSSNTPYSAKFLFEPNDITMMLDVQGDFTTLQFDSVSVASAYALAVAVVADIAQYASSGGGGSYTFPVNHGNVAYVSVDGNDLTGQVGNISKPFENIGAAIPALDNAIDGTIIILSSSSAQVVNDYDFSTMPYNLSIFDFANTGLSFGGSCSFGTLKVRTGGLFFVSTDFLYTSDDNCDIHCDVLLVGSSAMGDVTFRGVIECNSITVASNTNNPSITFDTVNWKTTCNIDEPLAGYTKINPRLLKIVASQTGTSDPTFTTRLNETGETFTFGRVSNGEYELRSSSALFDANKMELFFGGNNMNAGSAGDASFGYAIVSSTALQIKSYFSDSFENDDIMSGLPITIEFYP